MAGRLWKSRSPPIIRQFRCPECGEIVPATKRSDRKTPPGHVKTMWCFRCKKQRDFLQVE